MITVACPHPQTVRTRTISHIPEQSPSSPEHAGALVIPHPKVLPGLARAVSGDQAELPGPRDGLGAVGGAELAQDVRHVFFDRIERHDQVVGDALV